MRLIRFFIVFHLVSALVNTSRAETYLCQTLFPEGGDIHLQASSEFRVIKDEPFLSFRGSVAHFWKWLKGVNSSLRSQRARRTMTARLLSHTGLVVGDFHPGNWGDIELQKGRKTGLIDLDDVGLSGPLLGDYLRGAIGVQLSGISISPDRLWFNYVAGLAGYRALKPARLLKAQKKSDEDFDLRQQEYLQKLTGGKSSFAADSGVISMKEAPFLARHLYSSLKESFENYFKDFEILEVGYRMKLIGGSQRLPRFWFLLKDPSTAELRVVEAKYLVKPGTSEYGEQGTTAERVEIAGNAYRPTGITVGFYDILEIAGHDFQIRERYDNFLNFDPIKMQQKLSAAEIETSVLYIFNQLGRFQARQSVGLKLLRTIDRDPALAELAVHALTQQYVQIVKQTIGSDVAKSPSRDLPSNESSQTHAKQSALNKAY